MSWRAFDVLSDGRYWLAVSLNTDWRQWRIHEFCLGRGGSSNLEAVAYPRILFGGVKKFGGSSVPTNFFSRGGVQQIQLKTEDRENGNLGAVAP